jgi:hypothetical protein
MAVPLVRVRSGIVSHKKPAVVVPSPKPIAVDPSAIAYSVKQCSVVAGLSQWRIRLAIWEGHLPARRNGKSNRSALVVLRADLDAYLKALPTVDVHDAPWLAKRRVGAA